jgi:hypothetical protein
MKKLLAVACSAALMGGCGFMEPTRQGSTTGGTAVGTTYSGGAAGRTASAPGSTMSTSASGDTDFKRMDANSDGWVSREEYLGFYGTRYDKMKRNERGYVSWQDMETSDGRFFQAGTTSNTTGNPVTSQPGTAGGVGNPPATGGGSK